MTDKLLRWIADLCLIFDEDLDGDFPDDEYVLAHRAARKDPSPAVVDVPRPACRLIAYTLPYRCFSSPKRLFVPEGVHDEQSSGGVGSDPRRPVFASPKRLRTALARFCS